MTSLDNVDVISARSNPRRIEGLAKVDPQGFKTDALTRSNRAWQEDPLTQEPANTSIESRQEGCAARATRKCEADQGRETSESAESCAVQAADP